MGVLLFSLFFFSLLCFFESLFLSPLGPLARSQGTGEGLSVTSCHQSALDARFEGSQVVPSPRERAFESKNSENACPNVFEREDHRRVSSLAPLAHSRLCRS